MQRTQPVFSLAHLSALDLDPAALVRLAAEAGFDAVSLRLAPAAPGAPYYPLKAGSAELAELKRICDAEGVAVGDVEIISLGENFDPAPFDWMLETAAELGSTGLCVTGDDPNRQRLAESFALLCEHALPFGIAVDLEYMRWRQVGRLADAVDVAQRAGQPNGRVMIDLLHHSRAGGTVAELENMPRGFLRQVQVSDAPALLPEGLDIIDEARATRFIPGTAELPLAQSLRALPEASCLAVELPSDRSLPDMPRAERLRRSLQWLHRQHRET